MTRRKDLDGRPPNPHSSAFIPDTPRVEDGVDRRIGRGDAPGLHARRPHALASGAGTASGREVRGRARPADAGGWPIDANAGGNDMTTKKATRRVGMARLRS